MWSSVTSSFITDICLVHDCVAEAQKASVISVYFNCGKFRKVNEVELYPFSNSFESITTADHL